MWEEKIARLEKELRHTRQLLQLALSQNELLRSLMPYVESGEPLPEPLIPYVKTVLGHHGAEMPYDKTHVGHSETEMALDKIHIGHSEAEMPYLKTDTGHLAPEMTLDKTHIGHAETTSPHLKTTEAPGSLPPLPRHIPISPANRSALWSTFPHKDFLRVSSDARKVMVHMLLYIHNGGNCSHLPLGQAVGRSKAGAGKLVASLKRRGMVVRTGTFNGLALTPKALLCMQQAKWVMEE